MVWHFPNIWGENPNKEKGYGAYSAILSGGYQLIYTCETQTCRLYNIKNDIGEQNDLTKEHPKIVKKFSKELSDYLREGNTQRPSLKATGKLISYPDEL